MVEELVTEHRSVDGQGAESAAVRLEMRVGSLRVEGGAGALLDGAFTYNVPFWEPEITYAVRDGRGTLTVEQPETPREERNNLRGARNEWEIRLNDGVPIDLDVEVASGRSHLELSSLDLTSLDVETASGDADIRLNGDHARLRAINIQVASGGVDLELGGAFPALQRVEIHSASGRLRLGFTGQFDALETLTVDTASGKIDLDLSGNWRRDLGAEINAMSGSADIRLPDDAGASVGFKAISGKIDAGPLTRTGGRWMRDARGTSDATLNIDINLVSGSARLR